MRFLLYLTVIAALIVAYGYWHASTHGAVNISFYDVSDEKELKLLNEMNIVLRSETGQILATGKADSKWGTVYLSHPLEGSCYEQQSNATQNRSGLTAWKICFQQQSTWLIKWIRNVRSVDVTVGECRLENIAIFARESDADWWMWWVPLPHVGGKPYTYFSLTLSIDPVACRVVR